jgi:hypothetical protein
MLLILCDIILRPVISVTVISELLMSEGAVMLIVPVVGLG